MIEHVLDHTQSFIYGDAADKLADCVALDMEITDYAENPSHDQFVKDLQGRHERNFSFWKKANS
jgi:hypothetical protein